MKPVAALMMALTLSSCAAAATIPAQTEQLKQSTQTVDEIQKTIDQITDQQQQQLDDLCNGTAIEGFNC